MIALTTYDETVRYFNPQQIVSISTYDLGVQHEFQGMTIVYSNGDYTLVRQDVDTVRAMIELSR